MGRQHGGRPAQAGGSPKETVATYQGDGPDRWRATVRPRRDAAGPIEIRRFGRRRPRRPCGPPHVELDGLAGREDARGAVPGSPGSNESPGSVRSSTSHRDGRGPPCCPPHGNAVDCSPLPASSAAASSMRAEDARGPSGWCLPVPFRVDLSGVSRLVANEPTRTDTARYVTYADFVHTSRPSEHRSAAPDHLGVAS